MNFFQAISFQSTIKPRCAAGRASYSTSFKTSSHPETRSAKQQCLCANCPQKLMHWVAPSRAPRPSPFTLANFIPLARDGDREIVAGLIGKFWRPDFGLFVVNGPSEFLACNPPKTAKLAIGFVAEQLGEVTVLTTETRVYCPDRYSLIMFFPYWLVIRPVSGLLRRRALGTIRRIAESRAVSEKEPVVFKNERSLID
jgi:hypothetical protein